MITREEAKKRMRTNWCEFHTVEDSIDALLSQNQLKIDSINACRTRCAEYNAKMELDVDNSSEQEFQRMISTFTPYQDGGR